MTELRREKPTPPGEGAMGSAPNPVSPAGDAPAGDTTAADPTAADPTADPVPDRWDSALRHAFGVEGHGMPSVVMQSIHLRAGRKVHVALRDLGGAAPPLALQPRGVDWSGGSEGRYKVRGEIARGGVGSVLLAHDTDIGRDVAVKVLHEEHVDDAAMLQRFVEEAQIGGQLQHPGIVPVYELGLDLRQRPYFTMKLVQGETLAALLERRAPPHADAPHAGETPADALTRLLGVFARVSETVAYAHARGVVHRDLKPGNVMVGEFGEVMVMDWGFAKVLGRGDGAPARPSIATTADASVSIAGTILGTPAYMPPEQASGDLVRLDARADVFALGAILCEILTGRPPYLGDDLLAQARMGLLDPALARLDRSGADPALCALAVSCLQRDPAARPASAGDVRDALARHFASVDARAESARVEVAAARMRVVEERKRRRLLTALVFTAFALVGVAAFLYVGHRRRVEHTTREANTALAHAWQRVAAGDLRAALVAVEQARTALRVGTADPAASATVEEAAVRVERLQRDADIERRLVEVLLRPPGAAPDGAGGMEWKPFRTADVADTLREFGVDVRQPAAVIATQVRDLQTSAQGVLLRALHELALFPESTRQAALATEALLGAADRLDPDAQRVQVRGLWAVHDVGQLRAVRAAGHADTMAAATLELLGMALLACGAQSEAIAALADAYDHAPEDFWINNRLSMLYLKGDPPRFEDAHHHRDLAWAVHPFKRLGIELRPPPGSGRPPWGPRGGRRGR